MLNSDSSTATAPHYSTWMGLSENIIVLPREKATMSHEERMRLILAPLPLPTVRGGLHSHANTHGKRALSLSQLDGEREG